MDREELEVVDSDFEDVDIETQEEDEDDLADDADVIPEQEEGYQSTLIDSVEAKHRMRTQRKITSPMMTKYERTRVLSVRITQLLLGAPPLVDYKALQLRDERQIAERELRDRVLPLIVRRHLGPGAYEDWKLEELIIV